MPKEGLTSVEIDLLAQTGLESILQYWNKFVKKSINFGDLSMILTRMAYFLTAKVVADKTSKIYKPDSMTVQ